MVKAVAAAACMVLVGCAHAGGPSDGAPVASVEAGDGADAAAFAQLTPGDRLALAGERVMALRGTLARVFARVEALRDAVRARDALADWGQLVCLEAREPDVQAFAGRGERAWDGFRAALRRGDEELAWTRFELLRIARLGVTKELAAARACGSISAGAVQPQRAVVREPVAVVEPVRTPTVANGATARSVSVDRGLPRVFVPTVE